MTETPLERANRLLTEAADVLAEVVDSGTDSELLSVITMSERAARRQDRAAVDAVAALQRRGFFADYGYKSVPAALMDLVGWERFEARQRTTAAEHAATRTSLDGSVLPARLPHTAQVFAAGRASLRHVEAVAGVLESRAAQRLTPVQWAGVEEHMAAKAEEYTPTELRNRGRWLVEMLDQGEAPDDRPPAETNELYLTQRLGLRWPDQGAVRRFGDVRHHRHPARRESGAAHRRR